MIKDSLENLYTGITKNLEDRLHYHNTKQGARFTKSREKFQLVFKEVHVTLNGARRREIQIKKWRREKKEMLIDRFRKGLPTKPS